MKKIRKLYSLIPEGKLKSFVAKTYNKKSRFSNKPKLPTFVQIEPTTRCNIDCIMCMRRDFLNTNVMKIGDMSLENFKIIIDKIPTVQKIDIQGVGEPFLNKDIIEMIKYAKERDIEIFTITNGVAIGKIAEDIVKSGLDILKISFYSPEEISFNKIMRNSNMKIVIENIKTIIEIKKRYKSQKPTIELCVGVLEENLNELPKFPEFANSIGVKNISIGEIYGYKQPITLSSKHVYEIIQKVKESSKKFGIKTNINICKEIYNYTNSCIWPWVATYITWDGYVKPCCSRPYFLDFDFGNIFKEDFKDIWNNKKYVSFRKSLRSRNVPLMCRGCQYDFSAFNEK